MSEGTSMSCLRLVCMAIDGLYRPRSSGIEARDVGAICMDVGIMRAGELLVFGAVLHSALPSPLDAFAVLVHISSEKRCIDARTKEELIISLSLDDVSCVQCDMKNAKLLTIYMPSTRPLELEFNSMLERREVETVVESMMLSSPSSSSPSSSVSRARRTGVALLKLGRESVMVRLALLRSRLVVLHDDIVLHAIGMGGMACSCIGTSSLNLNSLMGWCILTFANEFVRDEWRDALVHCSAECECDIELGRIDADDDDDNDDDDDKVEASTVVSWGYEEPKELQGLVDVVHIGAACSSATAVTSDGRVFAWGRAHGLRPVQVKTTTRFRQTCCGREHFLAIDENDVLYGWGRATLAGTRATNSQTMSPTVVNALEDKRTLLVRAAAKHTLALVQEEVDTDSDTTEDTPRSSRPRLWSWGGHGPWLGRTNASNADNSFVPRSLPLLDVDVIDVACATEHTLVLSADGRVFSCGSGRHGRLGHGDVEARWALEEIQSPLVSGKATAIAAGARHSCAVDGDGRVMVWGSNAVAQLGLGDRQRAFLRPELQPDLDMRRVVISQLSCTKTQTFALSAADGVVYACGQGVYDGKTAIQSSMKQLNALSDWKISSISSGYVFTIGIGRRRSPTLSTAAPVEVMALVVVVGVVPDSKKQCVEVSLPSSVWGWSLHRLRPLLAERVFTIPRRYCFLFDGVPVGRRQEHAVSLAEVVRLDANQRLNLRDLDAKMLRSDVDHDNRISREISQSEDALGEGDVAEEMLELRMKPVVESADGAQDTQAPDDGDADDKGEVEERQKQDEMLPKKTDDAFNEKTNDDMEQQQEQEEEAIHKQDQPAPEAEEELQDQLAQEAQEELQDQPAQEAQEELPDKPAQEAQEELQNKPAPEAQEEIQDKPAQEAQEELQAQLQAQPAQEAQEELQDKSAPEAQEEIPDPPAQQAQEELQGKPAQEAHEERQDKPAQEAQEELPAQPAQEAQEELQDQPAQEAQEELQDNPAQEAQEELQAQPAQEAQEELQDKPSQEVQEELKNQPAQEAQEELQDKPAQEAQEEIQDPPAHVAQEELQDKPAPEAQEELQDKPAPEAQEKLQDKPAPEAQEDIQDKPAQEAQGELQDKPAPEAQEELQVKPVPEAQEELQAQPAQKAQEELQAQPAQKAQEDLQAQPAQEAPEELQAQPAQEAQEELQDRSVEDVQEELDDESVHDETVDYNVEVEVVQRRSNECEDEAVDGEVGDAASDVEQRTSDQVDLERTEVVDEEQNIEQRVEETSIDAIDARTSDHENHAKDTQTDAQKDAHNSLKTDGEDEQPEAEASGSEVTELEVRSLMEESAVEYPIRSPSLDSQLSSLPWSRRASASHLDYQPVMTPFDATEYEPISEHVVYSEIEEPETPTVLVSPNWIPELAPSSLQQPESERQFRLLSAHSSSGMSSLPPLTPTIISSTSPRPSLSRTIRLDVMVEGELYPIGCVLVGKQMSLTHLRTVISHELDNVPTNFNFVSQAAPVSVKQERKFTVDMLGTCAVLRPQRRCITTTGGGDSSAVESDADIVFLDRPLSSTDVESIEVPEAVADHNVHWRNLSVVDSDEDDEAYLVSVLSKSTPMPRSTRRTRTKRRFRKS